MKYYNNLSEEMRKEVFYLEPSEIDRDGDKDILAYSLGATIYMPGTRETICEDIIQMSKDNVKAIVLCLEDAIYDRDLNQAEQTLIKCLSKLDKMIKAGEIAYQDIPLIFIRNRNPRHLYDFALKLGTLIKLITGFALPKFDSTNAYDYLNNISILSKETEKMLYAMPIFESEEIIQWESRKKSLEEINKVLSEFKDYVLNIRIGATDFSSIFGIRRGYDITIYDIHIIKDCIVDLINNFARYDRDFVISGPVWEYFSSGDRILKPQLRQTPFKKNYGMDGIKKRNLILDKYIDGLIYEVILDKANGLLGKTVIHPSHIKPVQALYVVTHEEYMDALEIIDSQRTNEDGGVFKSQYKNKMNEVKPHYNWATKIMKRAHVYGVYNSDKEFINLL